MRRGPNRRGKRPSRAGTGAALLLAVALALAPGLGALPAAGR